jgi:hypothetical protein
MAHSMLSRPAFQKAFDLQRVPAPLREQFGYTKFGQSLLLASRLVEAGVSLVTVNWDDETKNDKVSPFWDTHHQNFAKLKNDLCPIFDRALAAFLENLAAQGLLDTTLVVVAGEFGRTPKIGKISQNAMTEPTGRDHFPHAFTVLLAGGGVRGGSIYGATSPKGDRVVDRPVSPADLAATIISKTSPATSAKERRLPGWDKSRRRTKWQLGAANGRLRRSLLLERRDQLRPCRHDGGEGAGDKADDQRRRQRRRRQVERGSKGDRCSFRSNGKTSPGQPAECYGRSNGAADQA